MVVIFNVIPVEIIHEICSYLDLNDLKNLRLASKQSNVAANLIFLRSSWFIIDTKISEDNNIDFIVRAQNNVHFKNIKFKSLNFIKLDKLIRLELWQLLSDSLECLFIDGGVIEELSLLAALDCLTNLKYLHIKIESEYNLCDVLSSVMNHVKEIKIEKCPNQSESSESEHKYLTLLENSESTIKKLDINFKSNTTLLFELPSMQKLFEKLSKSLKELSLNSYLTLSPSKTIQMEELKVFDKMKFKLDSLKIRIWGGMDCDLLQEFTKKLEDLQHLDLTWYGEIMEKHKKILHENFRNLETFKFKTDDTTKPKYMIFDFTQFNRLKELEIDERTSLIKDIRFSPAVHKTLESLSLQCDLTEDVTSAIFTNLINLKKLSLKNYQRDFSTKYMTLMFKNLKNLENLTIRCHPNRNEYLEESHEPNINIGNLQKLKSIDLVGIKNCRGLSFWNLSKVAGIERIGYYHSGKVSKQSVVEVLMQCPNIKEIYLNSHDQSITPEDEIELKMLYWNKDLKLRAARYGN